MLVSDFDAGRISPRIELCDSSNSTASHKAQEYTHHPGCLCVNMSAKMSFSRRPVAVLMTGLALYTVAPNGRKPLSADALFRFVRKGFGNILDEPPPPVVIGRGMRRSCPVLPCCLCNRPRGWRLMRDEPRARGSHYGIEHVPGDTQMGAIRNLVCPEFVRPGASGSLHNGREAQLGADVASMAATSWRFWHRRFLLPDDSRCVVSGKGPSPDGRIPYAHQRLGAAIIHPVPGQ